MRKKVVSENNISGSAKFPWVVACYVNNHKTSGNSCNSITAATIFYLIYYFSKLNELKCDKSVFFEGYYHTRFTTVKLYKWFHKSIARTTLYRALNVLIELDLVDCIDDNSEYGCLYRISKLGLELVKNDRYWLDGDVQYKFNLMNKNNYINNGDYNDILDNLPTYN